MSPASQTHQINAAFAALSRVPADGLAEWIRGHAPKIANLAVEPTNAVADWLARNAPTVAAILGHIGNAVQSAEPPTDTEDALENKIASNEAAVAAEVGALPASLIDTGKLRYIEIIVSCLPILSDKMLVAVTDMIDVWLRSTPEIQKLAAAGNADADETPTVWVPGTRLMLVPLAKDAYENCFDAAMWSGLNDDCVAVWANGTIQEWIQLQGTNRRLLRDHNTAWEKREKELDPAAAANAAGSDPDEEDEEGEDVEA
jgi:hypothetical protein